MKQTRIIHISFFLCVVLSFCAFGAGFYFGNTNKTQENILIASESKQSIENIPGEGIAIEKNVSEMTSEAIESMNNVSAGRYYLKANEEYLSVYFSNTNELYFETDIKVSNLPEEIQTKAYDGIHFASIEDVYSFLENYSS